jgi:4-amino-4-deoxy-L-arabinose transferase-like glycosyltransferase
VAAAAILRFATLSTQSLWSDEGYTAKLASSTFDTAVSRLPRTESTPPLYYALIWTWAHLFGSSALALRSLSALFGCITVVAVYWVGTALASRRVALIAAVLTAVSPIMVWYSQEARAYALLVLLCVLALGFFVRALRTYRRVWLLGWTLASAAALATHYFALFPFVAEAAWLMLRGRERRAILAALALPVMICAALAPLALYQQAHVPRPWDTLYTVKEQLAATAQSFLVGITWTPVIHRFGVALLAILACAAVLTLLRSGQQDERRIGGGLALLAVVTLVLPLLISLVGTNYLAPRNLLYAWPFLALLVAMGAGRQAAGRLSAAGLLVGCGVCVAIVVAVAGTPRLQREDWRGLLGSLGPAHGSRAVIVAESFNDDPIVEYYLPDLERPIHPSRIHEVDVITHEQQAPTAARYLSVPGLTLSSREIRGHIAVSRFTAPATVELPASPPAGSGATIFVQARS